MRWLAAISFVASLTLAAMAPALAQSSGKVWRLGVLTTSGTGPVFETFRSVTFPELAKQGFVEGGNLIVETRAGIPNQLPELTCELAAGRPDAVIAVSGWAIRAMRQVSSTIPIVGSFIGEDPVAAGFAASLARPEDDVTGIVMLAPELDAKRLDVLHETVPGARRLAALARNAQLDAPSLAEMRKAAIRRGIDLLTFYAAAPEEYFPAFAKMREAGVQAVAIVSVRSPRWRPTRVCRRSANGTGWPSRVVSSATARTSWSCVAAPRITWFASFAARRPAICRWSSRRISSLPST